MKKILFVTYGGGHVNIIDLVAGGLLNVSGIEFNILALTGAYGKIVNRYPHGTVKCISDYLHIFSEEMDEINYYGNMYFEENYNPAAGISKHETIAYIGLSFRDLVASVGKEEAERLYAYNKRQAFLPVDTMMRILAASDYDGVVATTSPRFEQAALIAGNRLNLKTVEILDLFGDIYPLPEAKHIITMNSKISDSLRSKGLIDRMYYELGQPSIEKTVNEINGLDAAEIKKSIGIEDGENVLLLATQRLVEVQEDLSRGRVIDNRAVYDRIFMILDRLHKEYNVKILLRKHPNENKEFYDVYLQRYPHILYVNNLLDSAQSIVVCDSMLTHYSTIGVEAIACGKDVLTYQHHFNHAYPVRQLQEEPFIFSESLDILEKNICQHFSKSKNKCSKHNNFFPSGSVENIVKLLRRL